MTSRPTSITIIAVILLVIGVVGIFGDATNLILNWTDQAAHERMAKGPLPIPVQFAMSLVDTAVCLVCGLYLLGGRNWARYLYLFWIITRLFISIATAPVKSVYVPAVLISIAMMFFLFRPRASAFFSESEVGANTRIMPSARRVVSFVCYVLAGVFLAGSCVMSFSSIPDPLAKWLVLSVGLLPAAVLLSIGGLVSPERYWAREVGIVLVASAIVSALVVLTLVFNVDSRLPGNATDLKNRQFVSDYTAGCLWTGSMGAVGGLCILAARKQARTKPVFPPIVRVARK